MSGSPTSPQPRPERHPAASPRTAGDQPPAPGDDDARWLTDREQQAWRAFLAATKGLESAMGAQLQADAGLSLPDYEVLVVLSESPEESLRVMALAQVMGWERSRLSHHLRRMEKRELVRREACEEDLRGQRIALTETGRERLRTAAPGHVATVRHYLIDALGPQRVDELGEICARIAATLPTPDSTTHSAA